MSAGKRDQIEIFFKKKFLSKIDVDLIIWSRTFIISKKIFLSIWSLFPALTPYIARFFLNSIINHTYNKFFLKKKNLFINMSKRIVTSKKRKTQGQVSQSSQVSSQGSSQSFSQVPP